MPFHEPQLLTLHCGSSTSAYLVNSEEEVFLVMAAAHRKRWREGFCFKPQKPHRDAQKVVQVKKLTKDAFTLPLKEQTPAQREAKRTLAEWQVADARYEEQLAFWKLLQAVVKAPTLKEAASLTTPDGRNYAFEVMKNHCEHTYNNSWSLSSLEPLPTEE